jgi:hypothetical protein
VPGRRCHSHSLQLHCSFLPPFFARSLRAYPILRDQLRFLVRRVFTRRLIRQGNASRSGEPTIARGSGSEPPSAAGRTARMRFCVGRCGVDIAGSPFRGFTDAAYGRERRRRPCPRRDGRHGRDGHGHVTLFRRVRDGKLPMLERRTERDAQRQRSPCFGEASQRCEAFCFRSRPRSV